MNTMEWGMSPRGRKDELVLQQGVEGPRAETGCFSAAHSRMLHGRDDI